MLFTSRTGKGDNLKSISELRVRDAVLLGATALALYGCWISGTPLFLVAVALLTVWQKRSEHPVSCNIERNDLGN